MSILKKTFYKTIMLVLVIAAVFGSYTTYAWQYKYCGSDPITDISVSLDGRLIDFGVSPQIINNRTMVAADKLFEALELKQCGLQKARHFQQEYHTETQRI